MTHKYIGTKIVLAWPTDGKDGQPGYGVKYEDGYTSWSPKDSFEAAYRDIEGPVQALTFGDALHMLKMGKKVARAGWNGKGMFVFLVQGSNDIASLHGYGFGEMMGEPTFRDALFMCTVNNQLVPWTVSQSDALAEDWAIV